MYLLYQTALEPMIHGSKASAYVVEPQSLDNNRKIVQL